jgi:hypothetical protein
VRFVASPHNLNVPRAALGVRLRALALLALAATLGVTLATAPRAVADPGEDRGTPASLREQLDDATKGYLDAKDELEASQKRQKQLSAELGTVQSGLSERVAAVNRLASAAYRSAGLTEVAAVLDSGSPTVFLDRVTMLGAIAASEQRQVTALAEQRERVATARAEIDREISKQREQVTKMNKRRQQAEAALRAAGGGQVTSGPGGSGPLAAPGPRGNSGCTLNDPTTSGCVTARLLHAYQQARKAGFTRYCSCYRGSGSGEHPKGRACDFAAQKNGFGGVATGGDRTYGNNLAAFFVRNASRLGVLYVIWFRKIWLPGSGWRAYRGNGDPASNHENHVHLSVR